MKFSVATVVGALAAAVSAKPSFTNSAFEITAGQSFTLKWKDAVGPVTIKLDNGPSTNLKPVSTLATGLTGDSFTWTPPSSLASDTYAFEISDTSSDPTNYSIQWKFVGSASASSTVASSTTASSTSSSSSTSGSSSTSSSASSSSSSVTTTSSATTKTSSSATTSASKTATTTPTNTNNGQRFASPLALVLVTFAALICFN